MIQLVEKAGKHHGNDWYVDSWKALGVERTIEQLMEVYPTSRNLIDSCNELIGLVASTISTASTGAGGGMAAAFGLNVPRKNTSASKRRILHGFEDGDVRLIENAVGKLSI